MGPMPMRLLRIIGLGMDVLGASRCRMAFVSRIAVINRKSTQREAAQGRPLSLIRPTFVLSPPFIESPHSNRRMLRQRNDARSSIAVAPRTLHVTECDTNRSLRVTRLYAQV